MTAKKTKFNAITAFLGSRKFFIGIVIVMALQALWIALTGKYPMAFDEDFHFGLIKLYADHLSPFWSVHPANGDAFGALTRDPSYLFHYLMSFPLLALQLFTDNQTIQVLFLRLMNVAFFLSGLPLFRRLLHKISGSAALSNTVLAVFILIPIVPLLAGQINYDNVLFPLTALLLIHAINISNGLKNKELLRTALIQFLVTGLFASLIKYAFLPIFIAPAIFSLIQAIRAFGIKLLTRNIIAGGRQVFRTKAGKLLLAALFTLLLLSFERYGINVIKYHTPVPDCGQVLTVDQCSSYGPWIRDYNLAANNTAEPQPANFAGEWLKGMWLRTFFTVAGPDTDYETRGPFVVPAIGALALVAIGLLALLLKGRALWRGRAAVMSRLAATVLFYLGVLYFQQYQLYAETGVPVAINGRYLIPIAPILLLFGAMAARLLLPRLILKNSLAIVAILVMAYGGGALTFILRSNDAWYWPSTVTRNLNHAVQEVVGPVVIGYKSPTQFLPYP